MQAYNTAKSGCSVANMDKLFKFANKVERLNHSNNPIEIKVVNVIMRNQQIEACAIFLSEKQMRDICGSPVITYFADGGSVKDGQTQIHWDSYVNVDKGVIHNPSFDQ